MNKDLNAGLALMPLLVPIFQADQSNGPLGIPWWVWFIIVLLALLIMMYILVRQEKPGPSLPDPSEQIPEPTAVEPAADSTAPDEGSAGEIEEEAGEEQAAEEATPVLAAEAAAESVPEEAPPSDDLKRIEGIGPKISGILQDAGISTYAQLAEANTDDIQKILDDADIRLAHPGTWPAQGKLAADGNWDELDKLQDSLKGGRSD